jgi:hypothetical protein
MFTYKVKPDVDDDTGEKILNVVIYCNNCHTVTDLDEIIKED